MQVQHPNRELPHGAVVSSTTNGQSPAFASEPVLQTVHLADPELLRRIAQLEARAEEQEAMLRRVLTLLVDWVENSSPETAYRTHAA